jgi:AmiR/NasT family two-component response regulator
MLAERVGMTAVDAFARIRAYAFAADRQLMDVAISIISGGVRLDEQF